MPESEAREHQRLPAYLGGEIRFNQNLSTFECLIKNISEKGAMISIDTVWDVPKTFCLYIAKHDKFYDCQTRWRTRSKLGISFTPSPRPSGYGRLT